MRAYRTLIHAPKLASRMSRAASTAYQVRKFVMRHRVLSGSLAALHSRNAWFGGESCYTCHADYGMFGTVNTKLNGMKHVYHYFLGYRGMPIEEAKQRIHLYEPYPNANCTQCHSTTLPGYAEVPEHQSLGRDAPAGHVSCASDGCHGPAHGVKKR